MPVGMILMAKTVLVNILVAWRRTVQLRLFHFLCLLNRHSGCLRHQIRPAPFMLQMRLDCCFDPRSLCLLALTVLPWPVLTVTMTWQIPRGARQASRSGLVALFVSQSTSPTPADRPLRRHRSRCYTDEQHGEALRSFCTPQPWMI